MSFYHNLTWSSFSNLFVCSNFLEELEYRIKSCPAPDLNCLHGCIHLVTTIAKCKQNGVKFRFQGQKTWKSTPLISSFTFLLYISPFVIMGHTIKFEYVLVIEAMSRFLYHVCKNNSEINCELVLRLQRLFLTTYKKSVVIQFCLAR